MHRVAWLLVASLAVVALTDAQAESTQAVKHWLDRMASAVNNLSYRGTLVYMRGDTVDAVQVMHRMDKDGMRERIVSLNGLHREVLRDENGVHCIFPESQSIVVDTRLTDRLFPSIPAEQLADPANRYSFAMGGTERVAGHECQIIEVRPLDKLRYGHRLWLEKSTGMLLKSVLLNTQGSPVEQMMFTHIDIGAHITDSELQPDIRGEDYVQVQISDVNAPTSSGERKHWQVSAPPGFKLTSHNHSTSDAKSMLEHLVFTDGLASISVYVEPSSGGSESINGHARMGAINVFGLQYDGFTVTAVGEVPPETVKRMASSVRPGDTAGQANGQ